MPSPLSILGWGEDSLRNVVFEEELITNSNQVYIPIIIHNIVKDFLTDIEDIVPDYLPNIAPTTDNNV